MRLPCAPATCANFPDRPGFVPRAGRRRGRLPRDRPAARPAPLDLVPRGERVLREEYKHKCSGEWSRTHIYISGGCPPRPSRHHSRLGYHSRLGPICLLKPPHLQPRPRHLQLHNPGMSAVDQGRAVRCLPAGGKPAQHGAPAAAAARGPAAPLRPPPSKLTFAARPPRTARRSPLCQRASCSRRDGAPRRRVGAVRRSTPCRRRTWQLGNLITWSPSKSTLQLPEPPGQTSASQRDRKSIIIKPSPSEIVQPASSATPAGGAVRLLDVAMCHAHQLSTHINAQRAAPAHLSLCRRRHRCWHTRSRRAPSSQRTQQAQAAGAALSMPLHSDPERRPLA
jgi:hypothetical protein